MAVTLDTIRTEIDAIQNNIAVQTTQLNNHLANVDSDISTINTKIRLLNTEDDQIHQEIHELSNQIDSNEYRISRLEVADYQQQIDDVNDTIDNDLQQQILDMDVEHHQELHLLANSIDAHTSIISRLEQKGASIPDHIIVSETEYQSITPEYGKYYFTYEEE